ncbi:exopolysaccharide/PEP-CTERM locus tyrosine autokinase [Sphingomonas sp. BE123]|uniref:AAA family ATPase n=1 Tax=Sphingomonas sp. BE123 TaxID=2817842 RepID=UPI0028579518|nr:AAA family ATPase [Sphingomonas sp. BE123]MDR6851190.1 exopolysaccharide/PEP-CTERM locus tyrosine autokinase [Sphingomonas sp. BE123]
MNDQTPKRLGGSLVERAVAHQALIQRQAAQQPAPAPSAPAPLPRHDIPPFGAVEAPRAPLVRPEPVAPVDPVAQPAAARRRIAIDRKKLADHGMLVPGAVITALAEEFRLVKRQLLTTARQIRADGGAGADDRSRMILVCSAKPNDGKTFCAINLALSLAAEKDVEILLVDADFAKPDVLARLGAPDGPGLLDVLSGGVKNVEDCIIDTDVPQLSVLPAGTRSVADTELLASARAAAILDGLAAANPRRIVIFDSPPILAASPASALASHVGQVMLVVRADRTRESELRDAVGLLDGCEHIQLLLNSVSIQPNGRRFGSYGAYYGEPDQ